MSFDGMEVKNRDLNYLSLLIESFPSKFPHANAQNTIKLPSLPQRQQVCNDFEELIRMQQDYDALAHQNANTLIEKVQQNSN